MKRFLIIILSVLPLLVSAANTLTFSPIFGAPGDTLLVAVMLTNEDEVTAAQVNIPLGPQLRYWSGSAKLDSYRSNGHSMVANAANDTLYVTIFSLNQASLIDEDGDIFTFYVILGNEPADYPLTAQVVLAGRDGQSLPVTVEPEIVTIYAPKIEVVTKSIDYGHIPIRATYTKTLQVRNKGNAPLLISNIIFSAAEFSVESTEYIIAAGQTQSIAVSFAPLLHGAISESVRLRSNAINDADVYGANIAQLIADPFSVNELRVQPASGISDDTVTVTLRMNNMETDLVGVQVSFKLPKQLDYIANSVALLERTASMLATSTQSNDTLTLMLYSLNNTPIAGEDGNLLTFNVRLNGSSGSYALKPINTMLVNTAGQNMVSAVYQAYVTIQSPTISGDASLNLGHVPVTQRCTTSYSVRNKGQAPLTLKGAAFLQEGFRLLTNTPLEIAKNQTQTLEIEFTPSVEGNISTTMQLYSNDPAARMKSVAITGSVYEPNSMTLSGSSVGSQYRLDVGMENYSELTGVQFDLVGLSPFATCNKAPRASAHILSWSEVEEGRCRFVLFAMDNTMLGHEGTLMTLIFNAEQAILLNGSTLIMDSITVVHTSSGAKEVAAPQPWLVDYVPSDEPTAIDNVFSNLDGSHKLLHNGQILILRGNKTYSVTGQEVK